MADVVALNAVSNAVKERSCEETMEMYKNWAKDLDTHCMQLKYNAPEIMADVVEDLHLPKHTRILDVAAGSGLVGIELKKKGYTNIDALDGSQELLNIAKEKKIYNKYFVTLLGENRKSSIKSATYDVVVVCGGFAPGHLYTDSFPELIRIVKPDGYICWTMRDYSQYSERFRNANFDKGVDQLCDAGLWKKAREPFTKSGYFDGTDAKIYCMQVI